MVLSKLRRKQVEQIAEIIRRIPSVEVVEYNPPKKGRPDRTRYPFFTMKVGESFFVKKRDNQSLVRVQQIIGVYLRRHRKAAPETMWKTHQEKLGVRVWRIK